MGVFAIGIKLEDDVSVQCPQSGDNRFMKEAAN
jgi:hypothetical protein